MEFTKGIKAGEFMALVEITKPATYRKIPVDVVFVVTKPFKGYAVTILGDTGQPGSSDRTDGSWPSIDVKCNGMSKGLLCKSLDSATFSRINVEDAVDVGLTLDTCRQSLFQFIRVTRTRGTDVPAMNLMGDVDPTNNCHFVMLTVSDSANACYLELDGKGGGCRSNTFDHVLLHTPWKNALKEWPDVGPSCPRKLLQLEKARDNKFNFIHLRLDEDFPYSTGMANTFAIHASKLSESNRIEGVIRPSDQAIKALNAIGSRDVKEFVNDVGDGGRLNLSAGWVRQR